MLTYWCGQFAVAALEGKKGDMNQRIFNSGQALHE